jgi:hypothetical protein
MYVQGGINVSQESLVFIYLFFLEVITIFSSPELKPQVSFLNCSNEGERPCSRRDNSKRVKIH